MSLIAMCCYDQDEKRTEYTRRTLDNLFETVNFNKHRLFIFNNASRQQSVDVLNAFREKFDTTHPQYPQENLTIIHNTKNIGTAAGINECWKNRKEDEKCIKMDNDVEIHFKDWIEELEMVIDRIPHKIGLAALKRKDLLQSPTAEGSWKSKLFMLPHESGQRWLQVEQVEDLMGTCVMYSSEMIKRTGLLVQPRIYGFDDQISALKCKLAGLAAVFIPHVDIDHIDSGNTDYTQWKREEAGRVMPEYSKMVEDLTSGKLPLYYSPFTENKK